MAAAKDKDKTPPNPPEANDDAKNPPNPPQQPKETVKVRVIGNGTIGHLLLKKGDTTDDADYVALLKTSRGQKLVEKAG